MISELPGDIGPLDPAVDELFRTLTSEATPAELADEQSALAMFRASINRPAGITSPASQPTAPIRPPRPGPEPARPVTRLFRRSDGWGIRLAAAVVMALAIGLASAAYTAVLPHPMQLLAHRVLGWAAVPNPGPSAHPASSLRGHHNHRQPPQSGSSPGHATPVQSAPGRTPSPSAHKSATPTASPSPSNSPSAVTGPAQLSATASNVEIVAGAQVEIDGTFTRSGAGVPGITVQLIRRLVGRPFWHLAGTALTNSDGNVAVSFSPVIANTVFRLRDRGVAHSINVLVVVMPPVTATLKPGASGLRDVLAVRTQYAHRGNVVQLEVRNNGTWTYLRQRRLNAAGKTAFVLSGKRLQNLEVRVVLLATVRHGESISNSQTVPPPN